MGLIQCNSEFYDFKSDENVSIALYSFFAMCATYEVFAIWLLIRFFINIITNRQFRSNYWSIVLHIFIIAQFVLRTFYFIGGIQPFCYDNAKYLLLADYPLLAQLMSMIVLSLNYIKTTS